MSPMKATCLTVALLLGLLVAAPIANAAPAADSGSARYIVVLKGAPGSAARASSDHQERYGVQATRVYKHALNAYVANLSSEQVAELQRDSGVAYLEADGVVTASTVQTSPPWGLDRIDQRARPTNGTFTYTNTGAGVKAYVIDTGIRTSHGQFGGRATDGFDAIDGALPATDCNGHGTHVAGTVGGSTYGVAKGVSLVAVRVLNCSGSGSTSQVIAGIDWVTGNHAPGQPAVANMSLGGGASTALDNAVKNSIADGVSYAIAAGNNNTNACTTSPARVPEAMTISATDAADKRASFANKGSCVDWFAPGVGILSAWSTSDSATNTISGTSMATPHTAGVAALYLQSNPSSSPSALRTALYNLTTKGIVKLAQSTANKHLLYTNL